MASPDIPRNAVVQGSPLSPHQFNIYAEMFTKALMSQIRFEVQIFMIADDTAYNKLEKTARDFQLRLNKKKCAILELKSTEIPLRELETYS